MTQVVNKQPGEDIPNVSRKPERTSSGDEETYREGEPILKASERIDSA